MVILRGLGVGGQSAMRAPRTSGLFPLGTFGTVFPSTFSRLRGEKNARAASYHSCHPCSRAPVLLLVVVVVLVLYVSHGHFCR